MRTNKDINFYQSIHDATFLIVKTTPPNYFSTTQIHVYTLWHIMIICAVVRPISAEAKLQLSLKAGRDPNVPQALIGVVLEEVAVALEKQQVGVCM